jgi:hypothetical protein
MKRTGVLDQVRGIILYASVRPLSRMLFPPHPSWPPRTPPRGIAPPACTDGWAAQTSLRYLPFL